MESTTYRKREFRLKSGRTVTVEQHETQDPVIVLSHFGTSSLFTRLQAIELVEALNLALTTRANWIEE